MPSASTASSASTQAALVFCMLIVESILTRECRHHTLPAMATQISTLAKPGLEGVIAAETRLSHVDGERGELIVAGHRLEELVSHEYEDVVAELWEAAGVAKQGRVSALPLPGSTLALLRAAAERRVAP